MKITMQKTLMAAAIAAMAVSGGANAALTNTATGDSSLILTLFSTEGGGVSATFDLGFSKSTFNQGLSSSWSLISGDYASAWSSFFSVATAANTQYAVFAGDRSGAAVGDQSLFTTSAVAVLPTVIGTTLSNQQGLFDNYIGANNAMGNHNSVANGASFVTSAGGAAYAGTSDALGGYAGRIGNFGGDTNGLIGTNLNVWNIVRASTFNLTNATATKLNIAGFNPYFNLSNTGALTYVAAVPEADSWAMLLAGLGLMGFIARRRTLGGLV